VERFLKIPHKIFLRLLLLSKKERCPSLVNVYLALLYHADTHGRCFPGYKRIIELSGTSSRTVAKALQILEREGLILVSHSKGHGPNHYVLQDGSSLPSKEGGSLLSKEEVFTEERGALYSVKSSSLLSKEELDPFNYNQYNYTQLTKGEGREKNGRYRKFGPPENPEDDWKYYGFSRGFLTVERERGHVNHYQLTGYTSSMNEEPTTSMREEPTSTNEALNFNDCSPKLQSLKCQTSMSGDELDPINYTQYNYTQLTKGEGREKNGRYRKFGPPENPEDDWKYYGFSR
jgi:hypothetical protein